MTCGIGTVLVRLFKLQAKLRARILHVSFFHFNAKKHWRVAQYLVAETVTISIVKNKNLLLVQQTIYKHCHRWQKYISLKYLDTCRGNRILHYYNQGATRRLVYAWAIKVRFHITTLPFICNDIETQQRKITAMSSHTKVFPSQDQAVVVSWEKYTWCVLADVSRLRRKNS